MTIPGASRELPHVRRQASRHSGSYRQEAIGIQACRPVDAYSRSGRQAQLERGEPTHRGQSFYFVSGTPAAAISALVSRRQPASARVRDGNRLALATDPECIRISDLAVSPCLARKWNGSTSRPRIGK